LRLMASNGVPPQATPPRSNAHATVMTLQDIPDLRYHFP
jgi:hypothetical protein